MTMTDYFEFFSLSLSTWMMFKIADYLFEKAKNFKFKIVFDNHKKPIDALLYLAPFFAGALPTIFCVDFFLIPSFTEIPIYVKLYWAIIYHSYCIVGYFLVFYDKKESF
jgi:hypothetical protein